MFIGILVNGKEEVYEFYFVGFRMGIRKCGVKYGCYLILKFLE